MVFCFFFQKKRRGIKRTNFESKESNLKIANNPKLKNKSKILQKHINRKKE